MIFVEINRTNRTFWEATFLGVWNFKKNSASHLVCNLLFLTERNFFMHISDQNNSEKKFWDKAFNNCFNIHSVDTLHLYFSKALQWEEKFLLPKEIKQIKKSQIFSVLYIISCPCWYSETIDTDFEEVTVSFLISFQKWNVCIYVKRHLKTFHSVTHSVSAVEKVKMTFFIISSHFERKTCFISLNNSYILMTSLSILQAIVCSCYFTVLTLRAWKIWVIIL